MPVGIICLYDEIGKEEINLRTINSLNKAIPILLSNGYRFLKVDEDYE